MSRTCPAKKIISIASDVEKALKKDDMSDNDLLIRAIQLSEDVKNDRDLKLRDDFLNQIKKHFGETVLGIVNDFLAKKKVDVESNKPRCSPTHPSIDRTTVESPNKTK